MGADISHARQDSRLDVGDMSFLEADRRVKWLTYTLIYELLEEVFNREPLPELVILDMPLVMGRAVYAQALDDEETDAQLRGEINRLRDKVEGFWDRHLNRCFPFAEEGPRVVNLGRRRFGSLLRLVEEHGSKVTPDPIDPHIEKLVKTEWMQVLSVGIERVLRGILVPEHRTAAFDITEDRRDRDAFPRSLIERGSLGFHYLTGLRGEPVQVETLGGATAWHARGGSATVDKLAADLIALTYFDHAKALPLPLWYVVQAVEVVKNKGLLEFYERETLRAMGDKLHDKTWLAGWEGE
jgi:hypothetical protein